MQGGEKYRFLTGSVSRTAVFCTKVVCLICSGSREIEYTIMLLFVSKNEVAFIANFIKRIPVDSVADPVSAGKSDLIP